MQNQKSHPIIKCFRIYREKSLLAPPLNQYQLWGLNLFGSDRNLRDIRDGREAMPQEWIIADHNKNLFLCQIYLFSPLKHRLYGWKLPNQRHVNSKVTLCDSYQVREQSLFLSLFSWKIHIKHQSATFLKLYPPETALDISIYSILW